MRSVAIATATTASSSSSRMVVFSTTTATTVAAAEFAAIISVGIIHPNKCELINTECSFEAASCTHLIKVLCSESRKEASVKLTSQLNQAAPQLADANANAPRPHARVNAPKYIAELHRKSSLRTRNRLRSEIAQGAQRFLRHCYAS